MATKPLPSPEVLRQLLRYEPETGKLFWQKRAPRHFVGTERRSAEWCCANWNARYADHEAFTHVGTHGYRVGQINSRVYLAHRVIMAIVRGTWDFSYIDHSNGDRLDNRLVNLRLATNGQNIANSRSRGGASSRYLGVARHTQNGNWMASITKDGVQTYLGVFGTEEEAAIAYDRAANVMHGEFARLNFPCQQR